MVVKLWIASMDEVVGMVYKMFSGIVDCVGSFLGGLSVEVVMSGCGGVLHRG